MNRAYEVYQAPKGRAARVLRGLALMWFIVWGLMMLLALCTGATLERGAAVGIPAVLFGPPALLLGLAWLATPPR